MPVRGEGERLAGVERTAGARLDERHVARGAGVGQRAGDGDPRADRHVQLPGASPVSGVPAATTTAPVFSHHAADRRRVVAQVGGRGGAAGLADRDHLAGEEGRRREHRVAGGGQDRAVGEDVEPARVVEGRSSLMTLICPVSRVLVKVQVTLAPAARLIVAVAAADRVPPPVQRRRSVDQLAGTTSVTVRVPGSRSAKVRLDRLVRVGRVVVQDERVGQARRRSC